MAGYGGGMRTVLWAILCLLCLTSTAWGGESALGDSEVVIKTIAMESADQSEYGQYLVASVIVNRARLAGNSLEWVVLRPKQFSCWNSRSLASAWLGSHFDKKARKQAEKALKQAIKRPFLGITHYHTVDVMPYWAVGHKPVAVIGRHVFYENIR